MSERQPASQRAEESVIGAVLRSEEARIQILGSGLESEHFYFRPYREIYETIVERYYGDDQIDPLTIAEIVSPRLSKMWKVEENKTIDKIIRLAIPDPADTMSIREHAKIIRRHADYRSLMQIASNALSEAIEQDHDPEEIAGVISAAATRVITGALVSSEWFTYGQLGQRWTQAEREEIAARQAGVELGAFFGLKGIDDFVKGLRPTELMILGGDPGVGKHLALDTPLPTPTGWTTMADVRVGDLLFDDDGLPTTVLAISEISTTEEVYELTFSDGAQIKASGTHIWRASTRASRRRKAPLQEFTSEQMASSLLGSDGRANFAIPATKPLSAAPVELPIHPYVLGCWLAEGGSTSARVTVGDPEILTLLKGCGACLGRVRSDERTANPNLTVGLVAPNGIAALRDLGVLGNKHIPRAYLRADEGQRWALLAGIADGDGWCDDGGCEITTVLPRLRDDIRELATSLGCIVYVSEGTARLNGVDHGAKWNVRFQSEHSPFWLTRKAAGWTKRRLDSRYVRKIERTPTVAVRCIAVSAPSKMYLCGRSMIPTHNTAIGMTMMRNFARRQMEKPPERRVGSAFFCLEMGEKGAGDRFAQMESRIEGERLRLGSLSSTELRGIAQKWAVNRELPIIVNYSGELRESQIKAMAVDAIRRHQIGFVIIDHFRLIKTDERFDNKNDADEEIVKFLKVLAKDLNLAVVCLAHTTKNDNRRPVMDDLRGSKMISAFADVVAFPYWPWKHASQEDRERGRVSRTEYEVVFDKVRSSSVGTGELDIDMSTMTIR